jgi:hypothetical protein
MLMRCKAAAQVMSEHSPSLPLENMAALMLWLFLCGLSLTSYLASPLNIDVETGPAGLYLYIEGNHEDPRHLN